MATLGSAGIALSINQVTGNTHCFVIGLCGHQVERFKCNLIELRTHFTDARLPALVWLGVLAEVRLLRATQRRAELENIQLLTGMHLSIEENLLHKSSIDIDAITHKITVMWHSLTWDEFALKTHLQAHKRLKETFPLSSARSDLDIQMTNIHDLLLSLQSRTASSIQHANIQLQTVSRADIRSLFMLELKSAQIYNFVNQRDSQVNIDHAAASRQLAELSLHDSSVMRSIALDSNKVAMQTRRDSTDMRIIACVTLGFLPPTFVAVGPSIA